MSDFDDIFNPNRSILTIATDDAMVRQTVADIEAALLAPKVKAVRKPRQTAVDKQKTADILAEFLGE